MADAAATALLRRNLGDTGDPPAWSDEELGNLLDEQQGDQDRALAQGLWELLAQGARWHDYTVGVEQARKSQVFDHLLTLYREVRERIAQAGGAGPEDNGLGALAKTQGVPTQWVW